MRPQSIIAFDPGKSTGIAIAYMGHNERYQFATTTVTAREDDSGHVQPSYEAWRFIRPPVSIVILERFDARLIDKYGIHATETVGGIKALADAYSIEMLWHTPAQRTPYKRLARSIVEKRQGHTRHEVDAMSHMLCYLYHIGYLTSLEELP